jgi:hypothetical protein
MPKLAALNNDHQKPEPRMPQTADRPEPMRPAAPLRPLACAGLLAALALAGCGPSSDKFAPACPQLRLLNDAADITRMRGQGSDLTDLVLQARITEVPANCKAGAKGIVAADVTVVMDVTRGPAATGREAELPYLVTVVLGDQVLDQKPYTAKAVFPPNVDRIRVTGETINLAIPVSQDRAAADYTIYASFRLTPAELAYNRANRR